MNDTDPHQQDEQDRMAGKGGCSAPLDCSARPWDECPLCEVRGWVDVIGADLYHCRACKADFTTAEAQDDEAQRRAETEA